MNFWVGEGVAIALRLFLYIDLLLLAGLALCAGRTVPVTVPRRVFAALAAAGVIVTIAQFLTTSLAMVGGDTSLLDGEMLRFLALETSVGIAAVIRILAVALLTFLARTPSSVAALATLAWSGHAGASEGSLSLLHRASDILHLLAASVWLGTLVLLLTGLCRSKPITADLITALRRFARVGTLVVSALLVSGIVNLVAITGIDALRHMPATGYGRLLGLKLALFAAMLIVAALNRWWLVPNAERGRAAPIIRLRISLTVETALAVGIVAVVAVLGVQSPID